MMAGALILGAAGGEASSAPAPQAATTLPPAAAVLLAPWSGPYGGVPPFDKVEVAGFEPALTAAMAMEAKEIDAIAADPAPPTFDNTIVALERAGAALRRVDAIYGLWTANLKTPAVKAVETAMSPRLSAFDDSIVQNAALFARIDAVHSSPALKALTPEQQRLVEKYWKGYTRNGARLSPADKAKLTDVNQQLAKLQTQFAQNELSDEETFALVLDDHAQLAGVPQAIVDGYAADAAAHGQPGKWRIANTRSAVEPFLVYASDRDLRHKAFTMWTSRGDTGGATDNNAIVTRILALRAQKAQLLGYRTYADWHLADTMAKTPQAALDLSMKVWWPAVAQVHKDVAAMQTIVDTEHGDFKIAPWDYRYYAEKLRHAQYDLDMNAVKPYLALDHVRDAMFYAANRLYGFTFTPVTDVPVFHPDVTVYKVTGRDGRLVGLWYFDPYARAGKGSGAWMTSYRTQSTFDGPVTVIVSNNANFVKAPAGQRVLISFDDAGTMFHEFGHALHGLNSHVTYPRLSGTSVARDFVEFPSQLNENWLTTPEVLAFLTDAHGKSMPPELVAKIKKAEAFNKGFSVVETQGSAIMDMRMHLEGSTPVDPKAFETRVLAELKMPSEIVMRHRIPQFGHVFAGEGYAAGYYGYLWAEVLDHDAFEAFTETGDAWNPAVARKLHDDIMAVGDTVDPAAAYRAFRGRDPKVDALLRFDGFPVTGD
jgi:peptidyl-dipeptidase Dcp